MKTLVSKYTRVREGRSLIPLVSLAADSLIDLLRGAIRWPSRRKDFFKGHHMIGPDFFLNRDGHVRAWIDPLPQIFRQLCRRVMLTNDPIHSRLQLDNLARAKIANSTITVERSSTSPIGL